MKSNEIITWLRNTPRPISLISKETGLTRTTIYNWIKGGDMRYNSVQRILEIYSDEIYKDDQDILLANKEIKNYNSKKIIDSDYIIGLQKDKIEYQNKVIEDLKNKLKQIPNKPVYHFQSINDYDRKTNKWRLITIKGDVSMTGYTLSEIERIADDKGYNSWIERYHPDSKAKLKLDRGLNGTKAEYVHNKFENLMWMAKDGTYICFNIDLVYFSNEGKVYCSFYWVNSESE